MKTPDGEPGPDTYAKLFKPEYTGPLAVWCAVIAFVLVVVAFVIVFSVGRSDTEILRNLSAAFAPFMAVLVAGATFATVLWRGSISLEQNVQARRQNDSKEEADLGLLLEKAHEHISNGQKEKNGNGIALGIAMLDTVARAENAKYAAFALYQIGQQIQTAYDLGTPHTKRLMGQIRSTFQQLNADETKSYRRPADRVEIDFNNPEQDGMPFRIFRNTPPCSINGATIVVDDEVEAILNDPNYEFFLTNCSIEPSLPSKLRFTSAPCRINEVSKERFANCILTDFKIDNIGNDKGFDSALPRCKFKECDLTDAVFYKHTTIKNCSFIDCFYQDGSPPKFKRSHGYSKMDASVLKKHGILSSSERDASSASP